MVCVAAVATGSATYAWFVSNNTVDATVSSISAQSNAAFLTINNTNSNITGTSTTITLGQNPTALYPSRPHQVANADKTDWAANEKPSNLKWQTAYAKTADSAAAQVGTDGKGIYYNLTHTESFVTGTEGYVVTSKVYVSSSQGAFNNLKVDAMNVTGTATENNGNDIVKAVGAVVSCGDEWELWEYDATSNGNVGGWKQTAKSTNSLSGVNDAADNTPKNFGEAINDNKSLEVNITLFYDGDYEAIKTSNLSNLGQASVKLDFSATPVQQGVSGGYTQGTSTTGN